MKSFKCYITESANEAPYSFYLSKDGKVILPKSKPLKRNYVDHAYIPITQPEDFGLSERAMNQLHDLDDMDILHLHTHGEAGPQTSLQRNLARLGYFQSSGMTDPNTKSHRYTILAHDHGHISDLQSAVRGLRESHPHDGENVELTIHRIKLIEPHELHPDIEKVLKPEHLETLFDRGSIHFKNVQDIDRFAGLGTKVGRDPGSGVERIPSPQEMMDKAGTDPNEPPSIRRGRFFQSESYIPTSDLVEVVEWENNTLFAISQSGDFHRHHDRKNTMIEHPDAFPGLNFMDRPTSRESLMGLKFAPHNKPKATAWGRIDNNNRVVHIITKHGMSVYGTEKMDRPNRKEMINDIFHRLKAIKELKKYYPEFTLHYGYEGGLESPRVPKLTTYAEHERYLAKLLEQ